MSTKKKEAFTLVELMLAVVLSCVIMLAVGSVMVSAFKQGNEFMNESITMQEVDLLARIFQKNVRENALGWDSSPSNIIFKVDSSTDAVLSFEGSSTSIVYSVGGQERARFDNMILSFAPSTNTISEDLFSLTVGVIEGEVGKTNTFTFQASSRIESDF